MKYHGGSSFMPPVQRLSNSCSVLIEVTVPVSTDYITNSLKTGVGQAEQVGGMKIFKLLQRSLTENLSKRSPEH
jgi:hypothetical protein